MTWRALLLVVWLGCAPASADSIERGVVIVVIDGDTVLFRADRFGPRSRAFVKLRLAGIDAPELDQPGGEAARQALVDLALKRALEVRTVATDRYGRSIAYLFRDDKEINLELVRRGHAWLSSRAGASPALDAALAEAQTARRGVWADDDPVPPWTWRKRR